MSLDRAVEIQRLFQAAPDLLRVLKEEALPALEISGTDEAEMARLATYEVITQALGEEAWKDE